MTKNEVVEKLRQKRIRAFGVDLLNKDYVLAMVRKIAEPKEMGGQCEFCNIGLGNYYVNGDIDIFKYCPNCGGKIGKTEDE